jgi:glucosamine--fructose-6-phosphate aminotransferase (isomerizing)
MDRLDLKRLVGDKNPRTVKWLFAGCGSSYHLAQAAASTFRILLNVSAQAVAVSEILFWPEPVINAKSDVFPVLISRSGRTSEVLRAAELFGQRGVKYMALTCDANELAQISERTLQLPVFEHGVVMTASFTSMLLALQYIAADFSEDKSFKDALYSLPLALNELLLKYAGELEQFSRVPIDDISILGQGPLHPIAQEVALKIMESSSTYTQFFHTLEFRHGPMSIVSEKMMVGALLSETGYRDESAVLLEMKGLGARTLAIANRISPEVKQSADLAIELGLSVPEIGRLVIYLVWGQLLGGYLGLRKGLDPDAPQNLSRVVMIDPGA